MTIFGPDLSSYQDGLDVAVVPAAFVIAKCTEGTYYTDRDYPTWRAQAAAHGKIFIPYHFVSGEDPDAQATHLAAAIGDTSLAVMLDFEPTGTYRPPLSQLLAVADACHRQGVRVALAYLPRWYWQQIGSPDLRGLDSRGIALVSSAYPGGPGYPGDGAAGWQAYGGMAPALYQYTDAAAVEGRSVDMNAFRGTAEQLATVLTGHTITGGTMALDSADARTVWAYSHGDSPDVHQTLTNAAAWAGSANAKLDQVLARLAQPAPAPPPVDAAALATALAPLLTAGATADELAHAVVTHLGDALRAG